METAYPNRMARYVETGNLLKLSITLVFFLDCTWAQFRWLQAKQPSMLEHATSALRLAHCSKFGSIIQLSAALMSIPVVSSFRTCPLPRLHAVAGVTPESTRGKGQFRRLHHNTSRQLQGLHAMRRVQLHGLRHYTVSAVQQCLFSSVCSIILTTPCYNWRYRQRNESRVSVRSSTIFSHQSTGRSKSFVSPLGKHVCALLPKRPTLSLFHRSLINRRRRWEDKNLVILSTTLAPYIFLLKKQASPSPVETGSDCTAIRTFHWNGIPDGRNRRLQGARQQISMCSACPVVTEDVSLLFLVLPLHG